MARSTIPWLPPRALTAGRAALPGALSTGLCVGLGHTSLSEIQGRTRLYWTLVSTAAVAAGPLARLLRPKESWTHSKPWNGLLWSGLIFIPPAAVLLRHAMLLGPSPWVPTRPRIQDFFARGGCSVPLCEVTRSPRRGGSKTVRALDSSLMRGSGWSIEKPWKTIRS